MCESQRFYLIENFSRKFKKSKYIARQIDKTDKNFNPRSYGMVASIQSR